VLPASRRRSLPSASITNTSEFPLPEPANASRVPSGDQETSDSKSFELFVRFVAVPSEGSTTRMSPSAVTATTSRVGDHTGFASDESTLSRSFRSFDPSASITQSSGES
jgi:hypothetical protein